MLVVIYTASFCPGKLLITTTPFLSPPLSVYPFCRCVSSLSRSLCPRLSLCLSVCLSVSLSVCLPLAEIRAQLVEQLKCLDQQCELRVQLLQDLQDFFRKKAEIEMDYSRNLEKLSERFLTKTRSTKEHLLKYVGHTHTHTTCRENDFIIFFNQPFTDSFSLRESNMFWV